MILKFIKLPLVDFKIPGLLRFIAPFMPRIYEHLIAHKKRHDNLDAQSSLERSEIQIFKYDLSWLDLFALLVSNELVKLFPDAFVFLLMVIIGSS